MPDRVFDQIERTDLRDPYYMEGHFSYLNMTARPEAGPVRDLIETWVREYPLARRPRIRGELREDDKFHAVFFELFSHALLRKVGYEVEVEPRLRNGLTPDFAISRPNELHGYVEVTVSTGQTDYEAGREKLRNNVRDTINQIESPRYFIGLRFGAIGPKPLKRKVITRFITEHLRKLEHQCVDRQDFTFIKSPYRRIKFCSDGWAIHLGFTPRNLPLRKSNGTRSVGIEIVWGGSNETPRQLMDKVKKKANKYKRIGAPFVVAINAMSNIANQGSIQKAVYGKPLMSHAVSAVLGGVRITPWLLADRELVLYHHPDPALPYGGALTYLPQVRRSVDGSVIRTPGKSVQEILGLPRIWPFS